MKQYLNCDFTILSFLWTDYFSSFLTLQYSYYTSVWVSWCDLALKQPVNKFAKNFLFLHVFLFGNWIWNLSGIISVLSFVVFVLFVRVHLWEFVVLLLNSFAWCVHIFWTFCLGNTGSGTALKWKKYSSGHRQLRSSCWTLNEASMWWR